ncbi:MAG: leucine-rich repeat domain-containing protein [Bacteroidia bacterium]|nr:leucine-rich repeat domain-containing protein [Bacteroidia bacterium]
MSRVITALALCLLCLAGWAQTGTNPTGVSPNPELPVTPGPLLNSAQLERMPWCYSIDELMRNPAGVYKLSLKDRDLKTVGDEILKCTNLQVLNLSGNALKTLPDDITRLQNLEVLILTNNRIRRLPEGMKDLPNLQQLYLGRNKLVAVPAWVGGLGKLRTLDISYNQLTLYEVELLQARLPRCEITH